MKKSDDTYLKLLGARIRKLRKGKMSQEELGIKIGDTDHAFIGRVERGQQNCTILTLRKIGKALGVSVKDLIDIEE
jgi:transcriptional regulator with XRE-family HTH domain